MKRYSIDKKASAFLIGFSILCCCNFLILYLQPAYGLWMFAVVNLLFCFTAIYAYRSFFSPLLSILRELGKKIGGEPPEHQDELRLAVEAINKLTAEKEKAIEFVTSIARGDITTNHLDHSISTLKEDSLGIALLSMRDQLKEVAEKEKERNWVTEKLASFSEIFRTNTESLPELCNTIISRLVNYLGANQATIFILNDENEDEAPFLEMVACYAYDRRKYMSKRIELGMGLLGQTFLEKETLYMTDLPQNYTTITSGLGGSTPGCLLIVPVKHNEEVLGMLEIASFKEMQPYHIEFIEKVSEGIASAISTTKIREHTSRLLEESQIQTQELKAQEEEMRQNMEELQATQEASFRMQEELRLNEAKNLEKIEELSQARLTMQEQEAKLKASQEKAQARSLKFKAKMEQLDIEIEGKNAQIKMLLKQLEGLKEKFQLTEEDILNYK